MKRIRHWSIMLIGPLLFMMVGGCAGVQPDREHTGGKTNAVIIVPQTIRDLAGKWEYRDSAGEGIIHVNDKGFGTYDWKDGRFVTEILEQGVWKGQWIQRENDREGGFELVFSEGPNRAEGRWWYTRIGKDHDPFEPGGSFSMTRVSSREM